MAKGRQVPSVGRKVHYRAHGSKDGTYEAGACRSADITLVDRDGDPESPVSLVVFSPHGIHFPEHVPFGETPGSWHWPEYVPDIKA